jgi:hypothetical protein
MEVKNMIEMNYVNYTALPKIVQQTHAEAETNDGINQIILYEIISLYNQCFI